MKYTITSRALSTHRSNRAVSTLAEKSLVQPTQHLINPRFIKTDNSPTTILQPQQPLYPTCNPIFRLLGPNPVPILYACSCGAGYTHGGSFIPQRIAYRQGKLLTAMRHCVLWPRSIILAAESLHTEDINFTSIGLLYTGRRGSESMREEGHHFVSVSAFRGARRRKKLL